MSDELPNGINFEPGLDSKSLAKFKGERTGFVQVGEKKYHFPYRYREQAENYYKFEPRQSDTWVMSYPRSGTTRIKELIWLLANNLDYENAKSRLLTERFSFLENRLIQYPEVTEEFDKINEDDWEKEIFFPNIKEPGHEVVETMNSPRFIRTHFPLSLMPGILDSGCKIIYVARNPKDVAVSWYHLSRGIRNRRYIGNFHKFWRYFRNDLTYSNPYWEHLKEAWSQRDHPNFLFTFYEEIQQNFHKAINKVATFLGKNYNADEIEKLADYLDIKNFHQNPMVNGLKVQQWEIIAPDVFARNGEIDAWGDIFSKELEASADAWIEENLRDTDLRFPDIVVQNNNDSDLLPKFDLEIKI